MEFGASHSAMERHLTAAIRYLRQPPIVGLNGRASQGFQYDTGNHFVVVQGVYGLGERFMINDPWGGFVGRHAWIRYEVSSGVLFQAYSNVNLGYAW